MRDPYDVRLAESIFGTADASVISQRVELFCRDRLSQGVSTCELFVQSVGAVFVLRLESGERVVLKFYALQSGRVGTAGTLAELVAVYTVQAELAKVGIACAEVIHTPVACDGGAVAAMGYLDGTRAGDARNPAVRRAMAEALAGLIRAGTAFRDTPMLPVARVPTRLWPVPHNVLFDLSAPGGEWIDDRARASRSILDTSAPPEILFHMDFSAANVRVWDGHVCAIYDMDSIALVDEMRGLASAAVHYTYTGTPGEATTSREQARAFVADYEVARGKALSKVERHRLDAAAIYAMAYTARHCPVKG
ncbi:phosphotransferase [Leptolyngbya sp. PCC 6406]|uniref:phosphotransferase n=1 Tax=Leptolyngbya sp. PCC 6406 TaxID=1173264 RepID=UPI0018727602|nr:phosphotransferase [Leptolyngbya sp. PCC 6406]